MQHSFFAGYNVLLKAEWNKLCIVKMNPCWTFPLDLYLESRPSLNFT